MRIVNRPSTTATVRSRPMGRRVGCTNSVPGVDLPDLQADEPSASRSHRSVRPHTFASTGRLVVESACSRRKDHVPTWLWIVIIVIVVLAIAGYFGRGRFSRGPRPG
jgi:hypothetical protein